MRSEGPRAADLLRLACHNLWQNKSRTALTVIIVAVISTLIMVLCVIGTSFQQNMNRGGRQTLEAAGAEYVFSLVVLSYSYSDMEFEPITAEDRIDFDGIARKYADVVDRTEYALSAYTQESGRSARFRLHWNLSPKDYETEEAYRKWFRETYPGVNFPFQEEMALELSDLTVADLSDYGFGGQESIVQGEKWSAEDNDRQTVWVGSKVIEKLKKEGVFVSAGDTATFVAVSNDAETETEKYSFYTCTVAGVFDSDSTRVPLITSGYSAAKEIIAGRNFLNIFEGDFELTEIELQYRPPESGYDYRKVYSEMKAFVKEVNARFPAYFLEGERYTRFDCSFLSLMQTLDIINLIVAAVLLAISVLILLLSVGSVVNTILISVDKNRRFLGLLKALGMRQKDIRIMTGAEILIMIAFGVLFGVGILFALRGAICSIMESMFSSMFMQLPFALAVGVWIPFWLPIVTTGAFFLFAWLFSRRAVGEIAGRNVIETVSEVE